MEHADGDAPIEGARQPDLDDDEQIKYIKHKVSVFVDDRSRGYCSVPCLRACARSRHERRARASSAVLFSLVCGRAASVLMRMRHHCCSTDARVNYGSGTLFLTTEHITWISASEADKALSFHWRSVLMHAVSRDTSSFPHPCIYCQVSLAPAGTRV